MNIRCVFGAVIATLLVSTSAIAQVDVGVTPSALISFQPIDDYYVGGPYLSEGIGGAGAGFGASVNIIVPNRVVVAVEYSTARFEQVQHGRLVAGERFPATTRLRDSLVSVLAGRATGGSTRLIVLGGVGYRLDRPTINDVETLENEGNVDNLPPLTGGVDLLHTVASRVQLAISGRYTFNERDERLRYLGIGRHIFRGCAGLRFRLD